LANPGLLYSIACTLVPRDLDSVDSWRDYLLSIRIRYFSVVAAYFGAAAINTTLLTELRPSSPFRLIQVVGFLIAVVGARSRSEPPLIMIALFYIAFAVVGVLAYLRPGSLAPGQ